MEQLMQYVWQYRLWPPRYLRTVDGLKIEVIDTGTLNRDSGPDFFNASVRIDGQLWSGNIEIHVRASDWMRHGHHTDKAYDSVVLHVVEIDDMEVRRSDGQKIPQMIMDCAHNFADKYHEMVNSPYRELQCGPELGQLTDLHIADCINAMAYERLFVKTDRIAALVNRYNGSWSEAIYVTIARALGFNTNSEPFQLLAESTPLRNMLRYTDSPASIEAMLFGQAGLIPASCTDPGAEHYARTIEEEYKFLATKFSLSKSEHLMWKMSRLRPQNFPHRRIAALAAMIADNFSVASRMLTIETEAQARALFDITLSGFWSRHYNFGADANAPVHAFSYSSVTVLLINVVVPVLYAYGVYGADTHRQEAAISLLQSLKPESNSIVSIFERAGIKATDAFTTQAMIQLRKEYCLTRRCIYCRIGHRLLSNKAKRTQG